MYLRLTLLLHAQEDFDAMSVLSSVMDWTEAEILPNVNSSDTEIESRSHRKRSVTSTQTKHTLCTQIVKNLLQVCCNSLLIGIGTADFVLKLSNFCTKCLSAGKVISASTFFSSMQN
ncbi:uncharacterized protein LOC134268460 [Saccostrea cucullata]|uniref:uncharacterized protein LOC134268460 n=1 Tax=Saccostrea cuccullata TaxID=36930 RepID=UPI002ED2EE6B